VIRKKFADSMPEWLGFDTDTLKRPRRSSSKTRGMSAAYFSAGDNQIAGVGDGFARNSPAWVETIQSLHPNFPVYGSVCEANEYMQACRAGEPDAVGLPEQMGRFIERTNAFALQILRRR